MPLTPEQKILISRRAQADSPSPAIAYAFWTCLGLFGGHRFYLGYILYGAAMAGLSCFALALMGGAIAYGGTPLDGVFFEPDVDDILRASQSYWGAVVFYLGLAALLGALGWWLADIFALSDIISRRREAAAAALTSFYRDYQPQILPRN